MAERRTNRRGRGLPTRVLATAALLVLLAAGCGQLGGTHGGSSTGTVPAPYVAPDARPPAGQAPDFVAGPSISGNTSTLGSGQGTTTRVVTVTEILPHAQQFQLPVALNLNAKGPLHACPVQGPFHVSDDFGQPRYTTNPPHPHAGNDIFAPQYTPIVAPFDGVAVSAPSPLGGNGVIVRGVDGYVYNAHLVSFGQLGPVKTGDVIGYVGNTGDAMGGAYHDHFEWHPYHPSINWVSPYSYTSVDSGTPPAAVDPFPYLEQACPHS
jgi:murein DD-endopeptidase MepM/ murein hydrolase activator NlpD